jgi:hypothetical protein
MNPKKNRIFKRWDLWFHISTIYGVRSFKSFQELIDWINGRS